MHGEVPTHQRVRIICKDNYKYEVAPSTQEISGSGNPPQQAAQIETAITNTGTNHHMLYSRGLAPHHPHHPHHVQAAAGMYGGGWLLWGIGGPPPNKFSIYLVVHKVEKIK